MNRPILLGYQLLIGISDTLTGALLIVAPELTLRLMHLHVPSDALPFLGFIGAFVVSIGLSCLYGAWLIACGGSLARVETVWLLTAFTRSAVAIYLLSQILGNTLEVGWFTVAASDGVCALIQAIGLHKGWLRHAAR
jgi:hypothetical protein